ncbi:uncharacterized protein BDW43DRAFT_262825 [Aspergillus alliaceus]|uniref:uncharacterized protein n=1 Tax=Petromyces alliaceus TaxID=209559 RepID=UPI0012A44752|nr:uncharacterized protein BDW43DRAFT_262825 [Aspergillus alliaceus]KAB8238006.1 hypothetical protein BDW43DRAFT_262825 [Aspergillus alliaceus]
MSQLADIFIELSKPPFDLMESFDQLNPDHIRLYARESLTDYDDGSMLPLGPYKNRRDYPQASIS